MPEINSKKFVQAFQAVMQKGGRVDASDVSVLERAQAAIDNPKEKEAARAIVSLLKHDRELDSFEVAPIKKALGILSGVSASRLPADLERVLTCAVPQANVTVKEYALTFDFSKEGATFPARAVITLDEKARGKTILEASADRLSITSVKVGGKEVPFEHKDGRLVVDAPGAAALDVTYAVKPVESKTGDEFGLVRDKYTGRMWTLTWPYNTGALFPSNSAPDDGVTAKVSVKVADGQEAVGPGAKSGQTFEINGAVPAYAISLYTAKKFESASAGKSKDGVEVTGYGMDARAPQDVREGYRKAAKDSLDFYSGWLGKYDYGNTLKLIEVEGSLGGMEHTGAVAIMIGAARNRADSKETAAHETAHHWFGDNLRIKSWGDFWMSEGFTSYATYRYMREAEGEASYKKLWDRGKEYIAYALEQNPHALYAPAHTDVNEIFDAVPYEMGAWMLRMIEVELGTATFDVLMRDWYQSHRQTAVSTSDFVKFAQEKTGKDFGPFLEGWNKITAVPSFRPRVEVEEGSVTVALTANAPFPKGMRIPLRLDGKNGETLTVMVDPRKRQSFDVPFKVKGHAWDPDKTVLANVA